MYLFLLVVMSAFTVCTHACNRFTTTTTETAAQLMLDAGVVPEMTSLATATHEPSELRGLALKCLGNIALTGISLVL